MTQPIRPAASNKKKMLINFSCGIGIFEDDAFKEGKIYSIQQGIETLYKGKINELGSPSDDEGLILEGKDKIFEIEIGRASCRERV